MGFGSGPWLGVGVVAALIALAVAGGAIILVPLAVVAIAAGAAWYVFLRAIGADGMPRSAASRREVRARSFEDADHELHVNWLGSREPPGGAEGGDESPSANRIALPSHDGTPWGDTDQHSSTARVPLAAGKQR